MNRSVSIAFRTYVTPMMATRALRAGLLLFALSLGSLVLLFLGGAFSPDLRTAALLGARHFLVMVGLPIAAVVVSEVSLRLAHNGKHGFRSAGVYAVPLIFIQMFN